MGGITGERNQNGQAMGRKGMETRRRLMDTTVGLLENGRLRDVRVADITRAAGMSTATFYVYFSDVTDVVLAALEELDQSPPELLALIDADWADGEPEARAQRIVQAYCDNWARHHAVFRVRNLAADEGDLRFRVSRGNAIRGLLAAGAAAIRRAQLAVWVDPGLDPVATIGVLAAMLERFAAVQHYYRYSGIERQHMTYAAAHMLAHVMGPPRQRMQGQASKGVVSHS